MKQILKIEKEFDIRFVKVDVAVRYGEEDIPNDFPLRFLDSWTAVIDIDSGVILDWPIGRSGRLNMKVCDEGSYYLMDENKEVILAIESNYVPNGLIPGRHGDYIDLDINENGKITNWKKNISFDDFQNDD